MNKSRGFTLMELMVAVGIVGILAAIAIPSYSAYVRRANRTDATRSMTVTAQALERCYSQSFTYAGCAAAASPVPSSQGYYTITVNVVPAAPPVPESYNMSAAPAVAPQTMDTACATFTLDSTGVQGATDSTPANNTKTCWGST